jgi:hypothetical protein
MTPLRPIANRGDSRNWNMVNKSLVTLLFMRSCRSCSTIISKGRCTEKNCPCSSNDISIDTRQDMTKSASYRHINHYRCMKHICRNNIMMRRHYCNPHPGMGPFRSSEWLLLLGNWECISPQEVRSIVTSCQKTWPIAWEARHKCIRRRKSEKRQWEKGQKDMYILTPSVRDLPLSGSM